MQYWEVTKESLVPIRAREYYFTPTGEYRINVHIVSKWCKDNGIEATRHTTDASYDKAKADLWTVRDAKYRTLFALRWS
jgi:hypothetical protein